MKDFTARLTAVDQRFTKLSQQETALPLMDRFWIDSCLDCF